MTLKDIKIRTNIYQDGKVIRPTPLVNSKNDRFLANAREIDVAGGATGTTINVADRGTIETMILWTDKATTTLTVKINGGSARKVAPILRFDGALTSLTVTNSDANNAKVMNMMVMGQ